MSLLKGFISHASPDTDIANRLAQDLRFSGHNVTVDTHDLKSGEDIIDFMNCSLENSDFIIILHSQHTQQANFQNAEINAVVASSIADEARKYIVIRLDDTSLPALLRIKKYIRLDKTDDSSYAQCIKELCQFMHGDDNTNANAPRIISTALDASKNNPFRHLRAEHFESSPDPDEIVKAFAPPESTKMGLLEGPHPCFIEGPRGTGKSMLLLSLRARNFIRRHPTSEGQKNAVPIFAFYLKATRGALCNIGIHPSSSEDDAFLNGMINDLTLQELTLSFSESLISEIVTCIESGLIAFDKSTEAKLSKSLYLALFGNAQIDANSPISLAEFKGILSNIHIQLADFVRRRLIYGEVPSQVPIATLDTNSLKRLFPVIRRNIAALSNSEFFLLLDEYENFFPYQQRIVNTIIKLSAPDFSVKVAKKIGILEVSGTTTGQELQEVHDYRRIVLVYDVCAPSQFGDYQRLLKMIVDNILKNVQIPYKNISDLLPSSSSNEVPIQAIQGHLDRLLKQKKNKNNDSYYREAALYRALHDLRRKKHFAGFKNLAFISSGVVRYFQEILGVAYHLTVDDSTRIHGDLTLSPPKQSEAVHMISAHTLTTLSKNVEKHGETLKVLLLDLGACLRQKLLEHTSEPEAGRVTIENMHTLTQKDYSLLAEVLALGVREGVFQTQEGRPAFRPKHASDPQGTEFNISRILAPVLQISPRLRWRTHVDSELLLGLITPEGDARKKAFTELLRAVTNGRARNSDDRDLSSQRELSFDRS